jgi:hypothetical protein
MFEPPPPKPRARVLYVSPLRALAVDVERNLRAPLAGIARTAARRGDVVRTLAVGIRTGDTPPAERAKMARHPPDILITTPESLFLLLTSQARIGLASVDTVIGRIHAPWAPSAARTSRSPSSDWRPSPAKACSASASRPPPGPWPRSPASWAGRRECARPSLVR